MNVQPVTTPVAVPVVPSVPVPPLPSTSWSQVLMMDAETAVQNAPFIELGRYSLAQGWSVVKIGNVKLTESL